MSASATAAPRRGSPIGLEGRKWESGSARLFAICAVVGAGGMLATIAGFLTSPGTTALSYLVCWAYWLGIVVGALVWLAAMQAARSHWFVVPRRIAEGLASPIV